MRKRRINQQPELLPGRFAAGQASVQRMVGISGVSPFRFGASSARAAPSGYAARRTGRVRVTLFRGREKLFFVPLLAFPPEGPPGA